MIDFPVSRLAVEISLNLFTLGLMAESYFRPPKGWIVYNTLCILVVYTTVVFLVVNIGTWCRINFGS